jgi:hypothetical protein
LRSCARSRAGCRPSRAILWTMTCPAADRVPGGAPRRAPGSV